MGIFIQNLLIAADEDDVSDQRYCPHNKYYAFIYLSTWDNYLAKSCFKVRAGKKIVQKRELFWHTVLFWILFLSSSSISSICSSGWAMNNWAIMIFFNLKSKRWMALMCAFQQYFNKFNPLGDVELVCFHQGGTSFLSWRCVKKLCRKSWGTSKKTR